MLQCFSFLLRIHIFHNHKQIIQITLHVHIITKNHQNSCRIQIIIIINLLIDIIHFFHIIIADKTLDLIKLIFYNFTSLYLRHIM